MFKPGFFNLLSYIWHMMENYLNFGSYISWKLSELWLFFTKILCMVKGHQMMPLRARRLDAFSTRDVTKQHIWRHERHQFTANYCMDMAALATVVSQARGIKFYGATAYHGQRNSCCLEPHNSSHGKVSK